MINMRKLMAFCCFLLFITNSIIAQIDYTNELQAIDNVLEQIIKRQIPSNPYAGVGIFKIHKGLIEDIDNDSIVKAAKEQAYKEIDSRKFLLYIPDTLFSLKKIIKTHKWIYTDELYEPMYKSLIKNDNFKQLDNIRIDTKSFKNIWKYSIIEKNLDEWPTDINYLKLKISRVCFNKSKTLGFFYIEVLDYSDSGYVTLILMEKDKSTKNWKLVNGTYYD